MEQDAPLNQLVKEITAESIMTSDLITVSPQDTVEDVAAIFYENDIRHVPVVENGKLIGILSERDIRGFARPVADVINESENFRRRLQTSIQAIYKSDCISLGPEAGLDEIVDILVEEKIGAIPIVEAHESRLIGIVSYIDVLKQIQHFLNN